MQGKDETIFISFDCAYRTLGWCILGYNPQRALRDPCYGNARDLFRVIDGGVEDVLGTEIVNVTHRERARLLGATLDRIIPRELVENAIVIIEHQPRQQSVRGVGTVRGDNQAVEAQLVMYFTVHAVARGVYLVAPKKKDTISSAILHEPIGKTYAERKKQSRRAYVQLASVFNFDVCLARLAPIAVDDVGNGKKRARRVARSPLSFLKADQSDACLQIFAALFLCAKSIEELLLK